MFVGREEELKQLNNAFKSKIKNWVLSKAHVELAKQNLSTTLSRANRICFSKQKRTVHMAIYVHFPMN